MSLSAMSVLFLLKPKISKENEIKTIQRAITFGVFEFKNLILYPNGWKGYMRNLVSWIKIADEHNGTIGILRTERQMDY